MISDGPSFAVPAFFFAVSLVVYAFAVLAEAHIAWHRREGWKEPSHRAREFFRYHRRRQPWERRYDPRHYEFDPRLDPILSMARRMARIVLVVSGSALLAVWVVG